MALHNKIRAKRAALAGRVGHKDFLFSIKQPTQDGRTVCGYFAAFGNKDSDGDMLIKGCFAKSIIERGPNSPAGNKIAHLWQHEMDKPLGKITKLEEDEYGLYFECEYDNISLANDALVQIKSGTLDKFSIGFMYVWDKMEYDETLDAFICKEINLYEGSLVTLAANDMAALVGVKSELRPAFIASLAEELEEALGEVKFKSQLKIRQITTKLIALAAIEPDAILKDALKDKKPLDPKQAAKKKGLSALGQLK